MREGRRELSDREVSIRKVKFEEVWRLLKAKDLLIMQRSWSRWVKEGDANSEGEKNTRRGVE